MIENLKVDKKDQNILSTKKKMLSEWIFPLDEEFSTKSPKKNRGNSSERDKYSTLSSTINVLCNEVPLIQSQRNESFSSRTSVLQKVEKGSEYQTSNSFYGGHSSKTSNKFANVYKKRLNSMDVSNVNELNVTSYKNFKIRSPSKQTKLKRKSVNETNVGKFIESDLKFASFSRENQGNDKYSFRRKYLESLQVKVVMGLDLGKKDRPNDSNQLSYLQKMFEGGQKDGKGKRVSRKNSIGPWENLLD